MTKFACTNVTLQCSQYSTALACVCLPSSDQRVASFCTLTDMQHGQDLEGAQEPPLCVDPGSGKDFMDTAGYVSPWGASPHPPHLPRPLGNGFSEALGHEEITSSLHPLDL